MNDVLVLFEIQGLEVFNIQFLYYYLLGIIAVIYGCYYLPEKLVRTKSRLIVPKWNPDIAENICWLLFLSYIASTKYRRSFWYCLRVANNRHFIQTYIFKQSATLSNIRHALRADVDHFDSLD